jgi:hypothetical protein
MAFNFLWIFKNFINLLVNIWFLSIDIFSHIEFSILYYIEMCTWSTLFHQVLVFKILYSLELFF